MRLRQRGTSWGCLVVVQFTLTGVPQWKPESFFGVGRELPVNLICVSLLLLAGVEWALARSGDVFVT